ncbi:Methyltransferase domain-containing protein [Pseudobutyrivibrio sp. JW11]|uniref:class I SAM-dependent methyltransferase n=1 Tax=Pseudobutyrivibrio sp. JW11 TaxID=1855302 RepID=UPI0008ED0F22|nr:class I SAM-dependent methyltransferase [Pseudobutyrivibrio sp. JW11]SFO34256.1 Methyltransferase domain-containing protein [Pseudobutyrivibrio sp. JW11]
MLKQIKELFTEKKREEKYLEYLKIIGCAIDENGQIFTQSENIHKKIRKHFSYKDFWSEVSDYSINEVYENIEERVRKFLDSQLLPCYGKNSSMFSMACGSGENELYLAPYLKEIDGYEYSLKMVQTANKRAENQGFVNLHFYQADASSCIFEKKYDIGMSFFLFAYLDDDGAKHAIENMAESLPVGGKLYLRDTLNFDLDTKVTIYLYNYVTGYFAAYRNIETYYKLIQNAGFKLNYEEVLRESYGNGVTFKLVQSVWEKV